jgi:hypothetical protein
MLPASISKTDPTTGQPVPDELVRRVERAAELLGTELGSLTRKFDIASEWRFIPRADGRFDVRLDLTAGRSVRMDDFRLRDESLTDDAAILSALRPAISAIGRTLSALLGVQLERIRRDLEALAAVGGD